MPDINEPEKPKTQRDRWDSEESSSSGFFRLPEGSTLFTPDRMKVYSAPMDFVDLEQRIAFYRLDDHQIQYLIDRLYDRLPMPADSTESEPTEAGKPRVIRLMRPSRKELWRRIDSLETRARFWMFGTAGLGGLLILTTISHIIERGGL